MNVSRTRVVPTPDDMTAFAAGLATRLNAGDVLLLSGPIGAGKTHFARALIQKRLADLGVAEDVPSPTFTLVQTYDAGGVEIWHADLYRLTHPDEALELGLQDAFDTAICLVEWPDRLGADTPDGALHLTFSSDPDTEARLVELTADAPRWADLISEICDD